MQSAMKRNCQKTLLILIFGIIGGMLGFGLSFPSLSWAEIYKYVDENGVVHFTNVPDKRYNLVLKKGWVQFRLGANFDQYDSEIRESSKRYGVEYALVKAVIKAESNFDSQAISRAGAKGLMQLMPGTADALGVNDSFHPPDNIEAGVRYLRYLLDLFGGNLQLALAAYNAGEEAVFRYNGIPPYQETQIYVQRVMQYFQNYSNGPTAPRGSSSSPAKQGG
jgi:soluble lytic murein transglycosylase-like protein